MVNPQQISVIADRSSGRNNHFNLIRMVAATGVLVSHAYPLTLGPDAVQPLEGWLRGIPLGTVCVYIFFATSGFFITKSFDQSTSRWRFLKARVLRLYPALALVLTLTVLVAACCLTTAPSATYWAAVPDYLVRNLALFKLEYTLPGVFETNPYGATINGSLWTLSYEVLCYFGVFIAGVLGLLRKKRALALALLGFVILYIAAPSLPLPRRLDTLLDLAMPFAIGTAFYVWRSFVPLRLSLGVLLAVFAGVAWLTPLFELVFAIALSYWVFLVGLAKNEALLAYNRLGDYSYGMYIFAFPVQQMFASVTEAMPLWNMALALPITLICAILSWHLVEKTALSWVR